MTERQIDRRTLMAGGAALAAAASTVPAAGKTTHPRAKAGFLWGTAGAAYQIEGGNVASDIWALEHIKPTLFTEPSGDADDTYNRIDDDLALAAALGFNCHRLSIEWSRIEPEPGQISLASLAYYRRILETCHRHRLAPVVTYNHYSVPRWFAAAGGFETRDGIAPFVRYCTLVTQHLGDLVHVATTFNEPNINALLSWSPAVRQMLPALPGFKKAIASAVGAPQWSSPLLGDFRVQQPIMIEAHSHAYDAIKAASGGKFSVGVTLALNNDIATGDGGGVAAKRSQVLTPWLEAPGDMIGIQNYTESYVGADEDLPPAAGVELTQMKYPYAPQALEAVVRMVSGLTTKHLYVTENGIATEDDTRRIAFIREALTGLMRCVADGIDVRGYMYWSLLDNWEWTSGYRPKFGLVAVDRTTFKRAPKPSARYYGRIARTGTIS